jgi:hypothetical protein
VPEESHASIAPCPHWCIDREYESTPNHPARHESIVYGLEGHDPAGRLAHLFTYAVQSLNTSADDVWILLSRGDTDWVGLRASGARSYAAFLVRLADVVEGLTL